MYGVEGYKVVLTADRTLMSNYGKGLFYGFIATSPPKGYPLTSPWLLFRFVFKPVKADPNGRAVLAPQGLRRIEASLIENGVVSSEELTVSPPEILDKVVGEKTKIIGIEAIDPLGMGPASTTMSGPYGVIHEESYTAWQFRRLVTSEVIQKARKRGVKVVVGGPGAWQIGLDVMKRYGIDFVVEGEGEIVAPKLFKRILEGENLETPMKIKARFDEIPSIDQIPLLRGATVGGVVEVSRGCGRGCRFCNPTLRRLRHRKLEDILKDVETNLKFGQNEICLHAEDILRYGSYDYTVKHEKVVKLFQKTLEVEGIRSLGPSHIALVSIAAYPKTAKTIVEMTLSKLNQQWIAFQTGIETGSPRLIEMHMEKKPYPFKPSQWPEVVEQAFAFCADSNLVPCATIIVNLPGETEDDVVKTTELIEKLYPYKSLITPLLYVPFQEEPGQKKMRFIEDAKPCHIELYRAVWRHDMRWMKALAEEYSRGNNLMTRFFMKFFVWFISTYANKHATKFFEEKLAEKRKIKEEIAPILSIK